jgi:hypothetical protein
MPPQQPVQPPKKKSKLWLILGIVVGAVVLCGVIGAVAANSGKSNTGTAISSSSGSTTNNTQPQQHFKVGDTVKVGTTWQAVVNSVKTDDGGQYSTLKSGDTYLVADISLTNLSNQEQNVSSLAQFTLQDTTGQKYDESIDPNAGASLDGKVEAGQPLRGIIAWEVPQAQHGYTLNFVPDLVSSGETTWDVSV